MKTTSENYQHPEYLVETDWLQQNLEDDNLRIIDCTIYVVPNSDAESKLQFPFIFQSGLDNFNKAHIPHAGYIDIAKELSDKSSELPLMMPTEEQFSQVISKFGITTATRVILYSSTEQNWATRLWWMLRSCGFRNAAVLNGGWNKWISEDRPTSTKVSEYQSNEFTVQSQPDLFVGKSEVLSAIGNNKIRIINSLPSQLYSGESDITFGRKGRITGSVNIPYGSLQNSDTGKYLPADKLQVLFDAINVSKAEKVITYCGGGIAASNNAFALALLGYDNVAVYDGSMHEWGYDSQLPMETG